MTPCCRHRQDHAATSAFFGRKRLAEHAQIIVVVERAFEYLVDQIRVGMDRDIGILPFVPGLSLGPRKSTEFLVAKVQSPSRMIGFNSQSLYPASPSQTIWLVSPWSLSIAIFASSGLRHSSIRNFILPSYGEVRGGR